MKYLSQLFVLCALLFTGAQAMNNNNNNDDASDDKELLDTRMNAFLQNSRITIQEALADDQKAAAKLSEELSDLEAKLQVSHTSMINNEVEQRILSRNHTAEAFFAEDNQPRYTNNNNNNAPASPRPSRNSLRTSIERMPMTTDSAHQLMHTLTQKIARHPQLSYETCIAYFLEYPELMTFKPQGTNELLLNGMVAALAKLQSKPPLYVVLTALLELGAQRDCSRDGKTPLDVALEAGNEMLIQLLTTEHPTKQTLVELAVENGHEELMEYLFN